jgi:DNA polymerase
MTKKEKQILMERIAVRLAGLKDSPLYEYRKKNNYLPVLGEGEISAGIMMIGEAPGRNEAKTGQPFCGAAGKVLDELLFGIGMERKNIYITNIVKDRPPENRDPSPEEIRVYGPILDRQIDIIRPKVIVALGRYSMKYIFEKFRLLSEMRPISEVHGKVFDAKAPHGNLKIVVLYHPCVAIYNRGKLPQLKKDIKILGKIV